MAFKRLIPTFNRILIEKIVTTPKTSAGILIPESANKVQFKTSSCFCYSTIFNYSIWLEIVAFYDPWISYDQYPTLNFFYEYPDCDLARWIDLMWIIFEFDSFMGWSVMKF